MPGIAGARTSPPSFRDARQRGPGIQGGTRDTSGSGFRVRAHSASKTRVNALTGAPRNDKLRVAAANCYSRISPRLRLTPSSASTVRVRPKAEMTTL